MTSTPSLLGLAAAAVLAGLSTLPAQAQVSAAEAQVNALEGLAGKQPGSRRSFAKGVCASGHFVGNTVGRTLSTAAVFGGDKVPAVIRFSVGGGNPRASDKGKSARGLAVALDLANGEQWQMANVSAPVFFVSRPEQVVPFLEARTADPATGKPDPAKLKAFNEANPDTTKQGAYFAKNPVPASYGATPYWSTNAFIFSDAQGTNRHVRWQFVPVKGFEGLNDEQLKALPDNFLADELRKRVAAGPVVFDFKVQLAEAGDNLTNPTETWPDSRLLLPAGQLVIDKVEADGAGACERMTFNPIVLPKGIAPSADPVLNARAAPYGVSLGRRLTEATSK